VFFPAKNCQFDKTKNIGKKKREKKRKKRKKQKKKEQRTKRKTVILAVKKTP
jgi:hypothetical protein